MALGIWSSLYTTTGHFGPVGLGWLAWRPLHCWAQRNDLGTSWAGDKYQYKASPINYTHAHTYYYYNNTCQGRTLGLLSASPLLHNSLSCRKTRQDMQVFLSCCQLIYSLKLAQISHLSESNICLIYLLDTLNKRNKK